MSSIALLVVLGSGVFALTVVFVDVVSSWVIRRGIIDVPNVRSSHSQPTPRGGGIAIIVAMALGLGGYVLLDPAPALGLVIYYALGGVLVGGISWADDVRHLSPTIRLVAHIVAALVVVFGIGGFTESYIPGLGVVALGVIGEVLTVIWIVGLINAYNFMDGIDGLAAGVGVVGGLGWFVLAHTFAPGFSEMLGLFTAMASLGFIRRNWSPASVFMGDVGSAFLGYTFAVLPLTMSATYPDLNALVPVLAGLLVWPFLFDAGLTVLRRLSRGERVFLAHRSHLYQRLVIAGWSHGATSGLYLLLGSFGVVLGWLWLSHPSKWSLTIGVILSILAFLLWRCVWKAEKAPS